MSQDLNNILNMRPVAILRRNLTLPYFFLLLSLAYCREIEVPEKTLKNVLEIEMNKAKELIEPKFGFKKVYKREVFEKNEDNLEPFIPCHQQQAEIQFQTHDELFLHFSRQAPLVIYNYEDIMKQQFMLDAYYYDGKLYSMLQNNKAIYAIIQKGKQNKFKTFKTFAVQGLEEDTIQQGYFVTLQNKVLFANQAYAIEVSDTDALVINYDSGELNDTYQDQIFGYTTQFGQGFQTAITIEDQYLVIGTSRNGIKFYRFTSDQAELELVFKLKAAEIFKDNPFSMFQFNDLVYYPPKKTLLLLDQAQGLVAVKLNITEDGLGVIETKVLLKKVHLQLMYLFGEDLYVAGDDISKFHLKNWPQIKQQVLEHPQIKVREIFDEGDVLAYVGRNAFKLMYLGQKVNFYQDEQIDKVIFKEGVFISANENLIKVGNYHIIKPYTNCKATSSHHLGNHELVFKTYAECNDTYFDKEQIDTKAIGDYTNQDICIYTINKNVYFWEKGQLKLTLILVSLAALVLGVVAVVLVVYYKNKKVQMVEYELSQYSTLRESGDSGKHQKFEEEMEVKDPSISQDQLHSNNEQPSLKNPQEGETK